MFLELLKNGAKTVVGVKQTQKAITNSKAKMVLVAVDADEIECRGTVFMTPTAAHDPEPAA